MAEAKTITVKLVLDTTEFDAAVERVKAALADLADTPLKLHVSPGQGIDAGQGGIIMSGGYGETVLKNTHSVRI